MSGTAVILIDMEHNVLLKEANAKINNQVKVLEKLTEYPQIVLEFSFDRREKPRTLEPLKSALLPSATFIRKTGCSGFEGTDEFILSQCTYGDFLEVPLSSYLRRLDVSDLVLMGFHRDACVYETAKSAVDRGFKIHTSLDVLSTIDNTSDKIKINFVKDFYTTNPQVNFYSSVDDLIRGVST
jgi:nicotinamidase-related amidase